MKSAIWVTTCAVLTFVGGCSEASKTQEAAPETPTVAEARADAVPAAVNGWREYPLREGVVSIQPRKWRTDTIDVPVKAGEGLEYKVEMKAGEGLVYNVTYQGLGHPGEMEVEFHGHTPQVDGVGDLMFYSRTGGSAESGVFTAPWTGIHGWYLKNDSARDVVARLELAGFYDLYAK